LYASYGDMVETEEAIALKLGFVHTPARSPLSARQLLEQGLVGPRGIDQHALRGNGLVAGFSKAEVRFSVFRALLCGLPLYYSISEDGILCCDRLKFLVDVLDRLELDEAAVPEHFLTFGSQGSRTYFRNVQRLRPGECLKWGETGLKVDLVKDLRSLKADSMGSMDPRSPLIYRRLKEALGTYIRDIQESGSDFGNLLSGGVDSSLTQVLINEHVGAVRPKSFSYRVHVPSFEAEVGYVKRAQLEFDTEHTFIDILPQDYPGLLVRATEVLGRPVYTAMEPCKLAIAEFLAANPDSPRYFFNSQGADNVFGSSVAQKVRKLDLAGKIPASAFILSSAGGLLKPFTGRSQTLLKAATILRDPNHLVAPINRSPISADLDFALGCFGEQAVQRVFEIRRGQELEYLDSDNYLEKVHFTLFWGGFHNVTSQCTVLFMAHDREVVYPFMDDDVVRVSFAIRPERRYIRGRRVKPILKDILEQRSSSPAARLPKLGSSFNPDVFVWMDSGPLRELVRDIERPGFLSKSDFERLLEQPRYYFLWALLTFDVFNKRFLKR
jgi:asparagine synthetase B (glutamine-hydrolysing)